MKMEGEGRDERRRVKNVMFLRSLSPINLLRFSQEGDHHNRLGPRTGKF